MKRIIFIALLCVSSFNYAQIQLQGVVKDSIGNPLELANVIAINQETKALESYGITNDQGRYKLNLKKNTNYSLQVSYISMKTHQETIATKETNITKDVSMVADNTLDEIELTYEMPITVKGDTLIYNADSFKNGSERKLEDVLEKLPGVEINDDGQIEVEGKVVNKLMVNGKDFFDGDTKLATKNIPSNAVDKVQVLRNFSEVSQLSGVTNNQDNVAINIKLKEGKENFWFGNITGGGGASPDSELYLAQPKLFYYSPKFSLNFIGDLNNIGELAITRRDLRGFGGGFRAPSRSSGTSINLGDNSLNFLTNQNNALEIENKLAATNFSYSPNKALDLSGFAIFNSSRILSRETSFVQYTDADLGIPDEATEQNSKERSTQGLAKLSASYKPNFNNQLDYDVLGRFSKDVQNQGVISSVIGSTSQLDEVTPFSLNQNLNYYYTLNETNIFAFEAQHLLKNEDPFYNALLGNDPNNNNETDPDDRDAFDTTAEAMGFNTTLDNYNFAQNRRIKSSQLDAKLDYYNILNSKSNINLTLGTILSNQQFNSNIFQFLENGSTFNPTPNFNNGLAINDTDYNFSDVYLGAHYTLKTGKFTITPGFSVHAYGNKNSQFGETFKDNFFRFLPDFETRIQFKKSESLTLRYNMQNQFTDVTRLAQGLVFNNFNSIQFGEPDLQNSLSHNVNLFYSSFNLFNYTNVFARVAYSKNIDQIRGLTDFENVIRTSSFFNSNFADESVSAFGRFQRTFGKIRASLSSNFNYSKINQFIQGRQSLNERYTQSYRPELRTNFRVAPNVRVRYNYSISNNNLGTSSTKFITNAPSIDFDAYIWKSVTFKTEYTYNRQSSDAQPAQTFETWDASLAYRKDKDAKWEYEIRATNLLDIDSRVRNSAGNLSVSNSETFIQPRFVTFRIRYEI
ncbi:carboxypeptidase-like regulatory domain-containing protein [Sabulilitoribacter arenilitoris]|uniref:Carboxypeptidase-like regulatory domain-containing protein n=1 Tax=Wocania arenilitoris TaxID=2044858 RepID=A0AAE3ELI9_9FLAO|nr:carboxypeptidase regulatory-like domain-containing protein [Wocania arenilitoris]MCF7567183.1 carboxypeptidase-like regulatory domain-containing protein [Wocania arenilitoris]